MSSRPRLLLFLSVLLPLGRRPPARRSWTRTRRSSSTTCGPSCCPTRRRPGRASRTRRTARSSRRSSGPAAIPTSTPPRTSTRPEYEKAKAEVDAAYKLPGIPGLADRLRPPRHPDGQARRREEGGERREPGRAPARDLDLPRSSGLHLRGGPARAVPRQGVQAASRGTSSSSSIAWPPTASCTRTSAIAWARTASSPSSSTCSPSLPRPAPCSRSRGRTSPSRCRPCISRWRTGGPRSSGWCAGPASAFPAEEVGGRKLVKLVVAGSALDENGKEAANIERKTQAEVTRRVLRRGLPRQPAPGQVHPEGRGHRREGHARARWPRPPSRCPTTAAESWAWPASCCFGTSWTCPPGGADADGPFAPLLLGRRPAHSLRHLDPLQGRQPHHRLAGLRPQGRRDHGRALPASRPSAS